MAITAEQFLNTIFQGKPEHHWILLWQKRKPKEHLSRWFRNPADAGAFAAKHPNELYYGVGGSPSNFGEKRRCQKAKIAGTGLIGLDIDIYHPDPRVHKKTEGLPRTREEALWLVASMPLEPSIILSSGYGLHAYWLLPAYLPFADDHQREAAATTCLAWNRLGQRQAITCGWQMDSTFDLSRVLRLPGSINRKLPQSPIAATVLEWHPDRRYDLETIRDHLPETVPVQAPLPKSDAVPKKPAAPSKAKPIPDASFEARRRELMNQTVFSADATVDERRLNLLFDVFPNALKAWNNTYRSKKGDTSASTMDMVLVNAAVRLNWPFQEVVDLIIAHRRARGHRLKFENKQYYARTYLDATLYLKDEAVTNLRRRNAPPPERTTALAEGSGGEKKNEGPAKLSVAPATLPESPSPSANVSGQAAAPQATAPSPSPPVPPHQSPAATADPAPPDPFLQEFETLTGLAVRELVKYEMDPEPIFYLRLSSGRELRMGPVANIIYNGNFRKRIAAETLVLSQAFNPKGWAPIARELLSRCRSVKVAPEATDAGAVRAWMREYLAGQPDGTDEAGAADTHQPYQKEGRWYLFFDTFWNWCVNRKKCTLTKREFLLVFARSCGKRITVNIKNGEKRTTRSVWQITQGI